MIVLDTILEQHLRTGGRAKYLALAAGLRQAVQDGTLPPGAQLAPVRDQGWRLGVTPGTVARAYARLTDEGLLHGVVGRGTFVAMRLAPPPSVDSSTPPSGGDTRAQAHLLSPKIPDMGQADLLRAGLRDLAGGLGADVLLRYPDLQSHLPARAAFLQGLRDAPIGPAETGDVFVGHGGQNIILMIMHTVLHGPAPVVAVDALSYNGFRSAAALARAEVVAVPWDDEGPEPAAFEALVRDQNVQVYCTSSEVNNPTLAAVGNTRRAAIAAIAARHGVHVVDDACYDRRLRLGPSYRLLLPDLGWYVTSPSKTLTAALRIGFGVAPRGWGARASQTATFTSFSVSRLITDLYTFAMSHPGLPDIMTRIEARVAADVRAAVNTLGGYRMDWDESVPFLWLHLPKGWRAGAFCQAAREAGVLVRPSEDFAQRDSRQVHAVRIALNGLMPPEVFQSAMTRLCNLLDSPPRQIST